MGNEAEMLEFAGYTGFEGHAAEWHEEYQHLCTDCGVDTSGLDVRKLQQLIDDESSNSGCYCPTNELEAMLAALKAAAPPCPAPLTMLQPPGIQVEPKPASVPAPLVAAIEHEELVKRLFRVCDIDGDGYLNKREMMRFAKH